MYRLLSSFRKIERKFFVVYPMARLDERESVKVTTKKELWEWLKDTCNDRESGVWVVYPKKSSGLGDMSWESLVDVCLCFGWIDSTKRKVDELWTKQYISPRKPNSGWSKKNKLSVERLIAGEQMQPAGLAAINRAKENGSWELSDKAEGCVIDEDLSKEFAIKPGSLDAFKALPQRSQKATLQWIYQAKTGVTRKRRMKQAVEAAREGRAVRPT